MQHIKADDRRTIKSGDFVQPIFIARCRASDRAWMEQNTERNEPKIGWVGACVAKTIERERRVEGEVVERERVESSAQT